MLAFGIIITVCIVIIGLLIVVTYSHLISLRNRVKESFASTDVYMQNRFDALTKIAEAVVAYAHHERETLAKVTSSRMAIKNDQSPAEKMRSYIEVEKALYSINVQAEAYPDLKASENYLQMQRTINELEEKLSASRRTFNANVTSYNTNLNFIPMNLIAMTFRFKTEGLLETDNSKKADIDLKNILRG